MEPNRDEANRKVVLSLQDQWAAYARQKQLRTAVVVDLELPSGMPVRATRPSLMQLLRAGRIPDTLTPAVHELISVAKDSGQEQVEAELDAELKRDPVKFGLQWNQLMDVVWCEAVVEPKFTPMTHVGALPEGTIDSASVDVDDKTFLFVWAQGVDQSVQEFLDWKRAREAAVMGTAPPSEGVRSGPGSDAGSGPSSGPVAGVADTPGSVHVGQVVREPAERNDVGESGGSSDQGIREDSPVFASRAGRNAGYQASHNGRPIRRPGRRRGSRSGRTTVSPANRWS